ncbi:MAG: TonB C-terminal domain-containing protein [Blastocatellia bacterium]|nr:TonB C-terminal domain-containing protein [Blastocatellia bacterium]
MLGIAGGSQLCQAQTPEDLPRASSLRGHQVPPDLAPFSSDIRAAVNQAESPNQPTSKRFDPTTLSEFTRLKNAPPEASGTGGGSSFKQVVSGVPVAGSLALVKPFLYVPPEYIRSVEQVLRLNLSLPVFAQTMNSTATVAYSFTVRQDGRITEIERERSTGSPALDNAIQSLLTSVSPLDVPRGVTLNPAQSSQPMVRFRFSLTYRPSN